MQYITVNKELKERVDYWFEKLKGLSESTISEKRNNQNRNIRMIVGHMVDSASNNQHRMIHMQYQGTPLQFPNYASFGNNDRWIAIQNYEHEHWEDLLNLWKYTILHFIHGVENINESKLENRWDSGTGELITLEEMVLDFPRHFNLHIGEIEELLD